MLTKSRPVDSELLELRQKHPEHCKTLKITDSNGIVREMVFPKALDLDRPKRSRTNFTNEQLACLEVEFEKSQYLVGKDRTELATTLDLSETQIKVWFQNRRTKYKRELNGEDVDDDDLPIPLNLGADDGESCESEGAGDDDDNDETQPGQTIDKIENDGKTTFAPGSRKEPEDASPTKSNKSAKKAKKKLVLEMSFDHEFSPDPTPPPPPCLLRFKDEELASECDAMRDFWSLIFTLGTQQTPPVTSSSSNNSSSTAQITDQTNNSATFNLLATPSSSTSASRKRKKAMPSIGGNKENSVLGESPPEKQRPSLKNPMIRPFQIPNIQPPQQILPGLLPNSILPQIRSHIPSNPSINFLPEGYLNFLKHFYESGGQSDSK